MRKILLFASALTLFLTGASSVAAATVTVGSPLTATFGGQYFSGPSGTWANAVLSEPGANPTSPVTGTVVRWRMTGNYSGGPFKLRVLHPTSMGGYTGSGTSAPVIPIGNGPQSFNTNLPIKAGDLIGLDITSGTAASVSGVTGSHPVNWNPALADGASRPPDYTSIYPNQEVGFNADVEPQPATPSPVKKCKKKKKKKKHSAATAKKKKCKRKKRK